MSGKPNQTGVFDIAFTVRGLQAIRKEHNALADRIKRDTLRREELDSEWSRKITAIMETLKQMDLALLMETVEVNIEQLNF